MTDDQANRRAEEEARRKADEAKRKRDKEVHDLIIARQQRERDIKRQAARDDPL